MRKQVIGATVEKSESAPGTGVTEAYSDTRGERRRVQRRKEHQGNQPGLVACNSRNKKIEKYILQSLLHWQTLSMKRICYTGGECSINLR